MWTGMWTPHSDWCKTARWKNAPISFDHFLTKQPSRASGHCEFKSTLFLHCFFFLFFPRSDWWFVPFALTLRQWPQARLPYFTKIVVSPFHVLDSPFRVLTHFGKFAFFGLFQLKNKKGFELSLGYLFNELSSSPNLILARVVVYLYSGFHLHQDILFGVNLIIVSIQINALCWMISQALGNGITVQNDFFQVIRQLFVMTDKGVQVNYLSIRTLSNNF